jgi:hypothetical protein
MIAINELIMVTPRRALPSKRRCKVPKHRRDAPAAQATSMLSTKYPMEAVCPENMQITMTSEIAITMTSKEFDDVGQHQKRHENNAIRSGMDLLDNVAG